MQHPSTTIVSALLLSLALAGPAIAQGIGRAIRGSGTLNTIAKFTDTNTIGDSVIIESVGGSAWRAT